MVDTASPPENIHLSSRLVLLLILNRLSCPRHCWNSCKQMVLCQGPVHARCKREWYSHVVFEYVRFTTLEIY